MTALPATASRPRTAFPWEALARPRIFWTGPAGCAVAAVLNEKDPAFVDLLGFLLIAVTALLPAFLWCRRAAHGIPIYPVFTLGTIWTFGLPLISHHPLVIQYEPDERLAAAATVAMVNLAGTACWFLLTRRPRPVPASYFGLPPGKGDFFFFTAIVAALVFHLVTTSVDLGLDPAIFSLVRAIILALAHLGIFVLGCRVGQRQLGRAQSRLYLVLIVLLILSTLGGMLMVSALSNGLLALMGFALGRGRIPWPALAVFLGTAFFLQAGKAAIRAKYWLPEDDAPVAFSRYPEFFSDWIALSSKQVFSDSRSSAASTPATDDAAPQSFIERASLIHLFLQIQRMSPAQVPYLHGATYTIIPQLLVPRVLDEQKARAHLGTYILAIHYDLQRAEDTLSTTIGFGLINEAMANFGYAGCGMLGIFLGTFYGLAARWSSSHPLLSLRAFFTILILTVAFENEFTAGVYFSVLFQGSCALLLFSLPIMRSVAADGRLVRRPRPSWENKCGIFTTP